MRTKIISLSFMLAAVIFSAPSWVRGQAVGEILGMVTDPSGAVIPNAKMTAIQQGTELAWSTVSTPSGNYSFPKLPVGAYTVRAEVSGFKPASSAGITLDVNQQREVNFTLAVAGSIQTVEVTAAPALLTTTNATLGGLVSGQQVTTLPLNGRDIVGLMMLQPGVNIEPDQMLPLTSNPSGNDFVASNGNRGPTGAGYLDGLDVSDNEFGGAQMTNFNLDAIAEFKILQNDYSAEYGRGAGTILQLASKAGTNQLHGTAFEYLRNNVLGARNFFSTSAPPFKRNEFGGTIGGPVVFPGIYNGKDRTFFFFQYAGFRQRLGEPILIPVPTVAERKGTVNIVGAGGKPDQLFVPLTPAAQTVLNSYPLPNQPAGPLGSRTFNFEYSLPQSTNQWSGRVDHRISDKDSLFARMTWINNLTPILDPVAAILRPDFPARFGNEQLNYGLTETHVFSPTLLHTFRFAYTEHDYPWTERNTSITQDQFTDGSLATWGPDSAEFSGYNEAFIFNDSVNWTKGRHTISTGGEYRRIRDNGVTFGCGGANGTYFFEPGQPLPVAVPSASGLNNLAAGAPSPNSLVSFLLSAPTAYRKTILFPGWPTDKGIDAFAFRRYHLAGWIQDDFKALTRLTLNLGFRYEYNSVPLEADDRSFGFVDDVKSPVFGKVVINPRPFWHEDHAGVGPRFGLAYKLNEKTVLRGGFAIFTNLPLTQTADQQPFGLVTGITNNAPFSIATRPVTGVPILTDLQGNSILPPNGDTTKIPPNTPLNLLPITKFLGGPFLFDVTDLNYGNGYTMAGNFTLERQLPGDILLQAGYVMNNAVRLYASRFPNAYQGALPVYAPFTLTDPGVSEFQLTDNHAHSTYNSLQVMARKTSPSHGLQFQASYTFSKAIDNATTVFNGPAANAALLQNNPDCWRCEKSVGAFDFPQHLVINFIYTPPLATWGPTSALPKKLSQGWQVTSIIQAQSGFPFTVTSPFGTAEYGTDVYIGFQATRPDLVGTPTLKTGPGPEEQFFSNATAADGAKLLQQIFATPGAIATGVQAHPGSLGRNTFRTHPFSDVDFSLIKDTKLTEALTLQFRAEFFNLFNLHAFNIPTAVLGAPGFGTASSIVFPERQIQFALKLIF